MRICAFGGASPRIGERYTEKAEALCSRLAERGHNLVYGAGGTGMMGAAARGFASKGAHVIGVIPEFFKTEKPEELNPYCDELIYTESMRERKAIMEEKGEAFLVLPGGIGTWEEVFEVVTLIQLNQMHKQVVIFSPFGYYDPIVQMLDRAVSDGFLKVDYADLLTLTDDEDVVIEVLESAAHRE